MARNVCTSTRIRSGSPTLWEVLSFRLLWYKVAWFYFFHSVIRNFLFVRSTWIRQTRTVCDLILNKICSTFSFMTTFINTCLFNRFPVTLGLSSKDLGLKKFLIVTRGVVALLNVLGLIGDSASSYPKQLFDVSFEEAAKSKIPLRCFSWERNIWISSYIYYGLIGE